MSKEYTEEILSKLQKIELDIFKDFKTLCEKHGLQYFGIGGTCIGVLRHQGFIPWDDDIDIALPRDDYEKMLRLVEEEYPGKYIVMNAENDANYPLMTTRLMRKGTTFREESLKDIKCTLGIFLDLYAFDNASDDPVLLKKQARTAWFWGKLMIIRSIPFPVLPFKGAKAKLLHAATAAVHFGMMVCRISKKWLYRKAKAASCRYNNQETSCVAYFCDTDPFANFIKKEDLYPLQELPYADTTMTFPCNMHEMLVAQYGDYMQLPPPEKRKNHYPFELDFGDMDE